MQSDAVGGTAPVISTAMFNLQSDQSRGTPRKQTLVWSAAQSRQLYFVWFSKWKRGDTGSGETKPRECAAENAAL